jgi:uncharacterized protein YjdB
MKKKFVLLTLAASVLALGACGGTPAASSSSQATSSNQPSSSQGTSEKTTTESTTSADTTSEGTTSEGTTSEGTSQGTSESSEVAKNGISAITAKGDYDVKAIVAAVTSKGYVLDDTTGAIYVYTALPEGIVLGDYVSANITVAPYFSIWEATAVNSITKLTEEKPGLKEPTIPTAAMVEAWKSLGGAKDETTAPTATKDVVPLTLTATAQADGTYTFFQVEGSDLKLEPSSATMSFYTGVSYELYFYFGGYNSSKSFASIYVSVATPKYVAPTGVTVTGTAEVAVNSKVQLAAAVAPTGANPEVTWKSADEKIATVDATGVVAGVAAGSVKITATSVADPTKSGEFSITVKAAVATKSLVTFDLSKLANAPSTSPYGALDAAGMLAIFKDTTYVSAGTNVVTSVETATAAYQANNTQGPKITGLKLGASSTAGVLAFTASTNVVEVKMVVTAWGSTKLASVSVNDAAAVALVAADATTARTLDFTIAAGTSVTIKTTKYCVITSLELIGE